jgi:hypothetical protein
MKKTFFLRYALESSTFPRNQDSVSKILTQWVRETIDKEIIPDQWEFDEALATLILSEEKNLTTKQLIDLQNSFYLHKDDTICGIKMKSMEYGFQLTKE